MGRIRKVHVFRVFGNKVLRMFGFKREEVNGMLKEATK
jgi:hypothetical protein